MLHSHVIHSSEGDNKGSTVPVLDFFCFSFLPISKTFITFLEGTKTA